MMVELLSVTALLVGGCAAARTAGVRGWPLLPLGFLAGVCLQLTTGLVQVITPLPDTPALTLLATVGLPAAWWLARWRGGNDVAVAPRAAALTLVALGLAVVVLRVANLAKWHTDSLRYLMAGSLLAGGDYPAAMSTHDLTKRLIGVPLLHAPAHLAGEYHLRSVTALLAAATVAALVWAVRQGLRELDGARVSLLAALGVGMLVTNNRFVFSAFYLNGHLLFAALLLVAVTAGWLLAAGRPVPGLGTLQLLTIPAMVVTRPEAPLAVGLALLPTLLCGAVPRRHRAALLGAFGGSLLAWHGFVAWVHIERGAAMPATVWAMLPAGVAALALIPLLRWAPVGRLLERPGRVLGATEAGLWLALGAFAVREPAILVDSLAATVRNVVGGYGKWGLSLVALGVLVVAALLVARPAYGSFLRFPVTTFVPAAFLVAYLRDAAFRVGYGDSLSRMFLQIVPVAVLYVIVAAADHSGRPVAPAAPDADAGPPPLATVGAVTSVSDPTPPRPA